MKIQKVKISKFCNTTQGIQIPKSEQLDIYREGYKRYLYIEDFKNEKQIKYVQDKYPLKEVTERDLVMANTGTPGAVFKGKSGILSNNLFKISFDTNIINRDFLFYILSSDIFQGILQEQMKGGIQQHLGHKTIGIQEVPMPPINNQRKIVQALDKAQELIDKRKEQIEKLDEFIQSVFLDMFGDPVTNSKNWNVKKLLETGELKRGKSKHRPRNAPELLGGPYPLVQTGDIANSGLYITHFSQTYSEFGLKQSKLWPVGTLCITIAANIAQTGILTFNACFPDSVVAYLPGPDMNKNYVQFWFMFLQKIIEANAPESAQKNINLKILSELGIPVPSINLQNKFAEIVQKTEQQKELFQNSLIKLEDNFNSLMQRAFKGELFS